MCRCLQNSARINPRVRACRPRCERGAGANCARAGTKLEPAYPSGVRHMFHGEAALQRRTRSPTWSATTTCYNTNPMQRSMRAPTLVLGACMPCRLLQRQQRRGLGGQVVRTCGQRPWGWSFHSLTSHAWHWRPSPSVHGRPGKRWSSAAGADK